jgi:surface polysaccharide O-acyltransferase-like enzyme
VPLRHFLLLRVGRILIPFLLWSGVYFLYRLQVKGHTLAPGDFFRMLLTEPIYYHLWFIYMLVVLYLFAPAISVFLNQAPKKHVWYLIALWFFWASLLPIVDQPLPLDIYFTPDMDDYSALRLSGYFLLGFMLRDRHARSRRQLAMTLLLFLAGGAATIFGTYFMSRHRGDFDPFFYKYFSVSVVAMTVALFLLVKSLCRGREEGVAEGAGRAGTRSPLLLRKIGTSVFGVYLAHALVLELLRDGRLGFTIDHTSVFGAALPLAAGVPVFALAVFGLSLAAIALLRAIPLVRDLAT